MLQSFVKLTALIALLTSTAVYASSIDYRGNQSADYLRTLSRNASLDAADIVKYNPGGVAFLEDGIHLNVGAQHLFKVYTQKTSDGTEYESDVPSHFVPNLYAAFVKDNWAVFGGFSITAGGGSVDYEDGISMMPSAAALVGGQLQQAAAANPAFPLDATQVGAEFKSGELEAKSVYYGFILGGSYAINDMFSFSLGARALISQREYKGEAVYQPTYAGVATDQLGDPQTLKIDSKQEATGFGGIIGLDIKPMEKMNIGILYETQTNIEYEADTKENDFAAIMPHLVDGEKQKRNLPAVLGLGVSYQILDNLLASTSFTYYFIEMADEGDDDAYDDDYENGWDLGLGVQYRVITPLELGAGYLYSDTGASEDTVSDLDNTLDSHNISVGAKYTVIENLDLTLAYIYSNYASLENDDKTEYSKAVNSFGYGVNYKF